MSDDYGFRFRESAPGHGYHASHRAVAGERPAEPERRVIRTKRQVDAVDPGRLRRAAVRPVKKLGPQQFAVKGNTEPVWYVDLSQDPPCTCPDQSFHGRGCLHELCARMANGDMTLIRTLAELYEPQVRAEREMGLTDTEESE